MQAKFCVAIAGLGLACAPAMFAQAMVGYGHGVARAGAAGAASGTGLAGIFAGLKDSADDAAKDKPAYRSTEAAEEGDSSRTESSNTPRKFTTSSGVVVAGLAPSWMGSEIHRRGGPEVAVKRAEWSNPQVEAAGAETSPGGDAPATAGATQSAPTADAASVPARIVSGAPQFSGEGGETLSAGGASPRPPVHTDAEAAGIRLGSSIDEVIDTLGRPSFVLSGVVGKSYTEKYVFKTGADETITVFTWTGTVVSVQRS